MANQSLPVCSSCLRSRPCRLDFRPSGHASLTFSPLAVDECEIGHKEYLEANAVSLLLSTVLRCTIVIPIQFFLSMHRGWLVSKLFLLIFPRSSEVDGASAAFCGGVRGETPRKRVR